MKTNRFVRISIAALMMAVAAWFIAPFCVSLPKALMENQCGSPVILDRHGMPILHLTWPDATRSNPVSLDEFPSDLVACTLAAEDKRFRTHRGFDFLATLRAARDLVQKRRVVSGASTITQQLIKISCPARKRTPFVKIYEILAARKLETQWSKDKILTAYLNRIDYGNLRTGAAEAARFYFQKPLADMSLAECALLAGIPQAPTRLNPLKHPDKSLKRRNTVLHRLAAIDNGQASRITHAITESLDLRPLSDKPSVRWLATRSSLDMNISKDGKVHTTIDLSIQTDCEAIVREESTKLRSANLRHAAIVAIHNPTGEILAMVSSADWNDARGGQFNGTMVPRSPGSTLKPFTYLLAIERNHRTPASILADIPSPFRTPQGITLPENYDHSYRGPVTLRSALACSLNIPAMRELNALGGPEPLHELLETLGLSTLDQQPTTYGLGLTIGNAPVRLLELTNAYATLARNGRHLPPVLFAAQCTSPISYLPFSQDSYYLISDILSDPTARAPSFPPGGPLDLPFRCAVKTGTSSDFRDNWCIGYTPEFTIGVWAGNFENQPMKGISGISGAGPIFHRAMLRLHQNHSPVWFTKPMGLVEVRIDSRTGKQIATMGDNQHTRQDLVPQNQLPSIASITDYDSNGKALLDGSYTEWFNSQYNLRKNELALDPAPAVIEPLKIISPADGLTLLLDPEIPSRTDHLRPLTNLPGTARWSSPTLLIDPCAPEPIIHLVPGTHTVTALDPRTGASQNITLHVKEL